MTNRTRTVTLNRNYTLNICISMVFSSSHTIKSSRRLLNVQKIIWK